MPEVTRFRHKPTVIEAVRWTGSNLAELGEFAGSRFTADDPESPSRDPDVTGRVYDKLHSSWIGVKTGQWVARGTRGELWPIDHEVLRDTYDPADGEPEAGAGSGCACYQGAVAHAHDSDEDGDCVVCGCGRYSEPDPIGPEGGGDAS